MKDIVVVVLFSVILSNIISLGIVVYSWNRLYEMTVLDNKKFLKELDNVLKTKEK